MHNVGNEIQPKSECLTQNSCHTGTPVKMFNWPVNLGESCHILPSPSKYIILTEVGKTFNYETFCKSHQQL